MRILAVLLFLGLLLGYAQRLQDVPQADQKAIQSVIMAQVEAFKKDDAATAFSFAAPNIRGIFATPERFVEMVKGQYYEIYRPLTVEFGKATRSTGALVSQLVTFIGQDSKKIRALYLMERQPDGKWKIAGVQQQEDDPGTT